MLIIHGYRAISVALRTVALCHARVVRCPNGKMRDLGGQHVHTHTHGSMRGQRSERDADTATVLTERGRGRRLSGHDR